MALFHLLFPIFSRRFILFAYLILSPAELRASSHWIVTENGRIQAQANSIFHMKRPFDLVAFMAQEARAERLEALRPADDELSWAASSTSAGSTMHTDSKEDRMTTDDEVDAAVESRFFSEDEDCVGAAQPLDQFDLHISTHSQPDSSVPGVSSILDHEKFRRVPDGWGYLEPFCEGREKVEEFISGLEVLKDGRLSEPGIERVVLDSGRFHLRQYGHLVRQALAPNWSFPGDDNSVVANWLPGLLAASYWRIVGDPVEAVACLRKAIKFSPVKHRHHGLLSLANILHRVDRSNDAANVLEESLQISPGNPLTHFALGNIYAALKDFQRSDFHFAESIRFHPVDFRFRTTMLEEARVRRHAVRCQMKLEMALMERQEMLRTTLRELKVYKKQHDTWMETLSTIIESQATLESKMEARMNYEQFKIQSSPDGRGQDCVQYEQLGHTYLSCNLRRDQDKHGHLYKDMESGSNDSIDLERLMKSFQARLDSMGGGGVGASDLKEQSIGHSAEEDPEVEVYVDTLDDPNRPTKTAPYADWPEAEGFRMFADSTDARHMYAEFPTEQECTESELATRPPQWNEYPTVFLSPENKGFDVFSMLTEDVDMPADEAAPFPWFPPTCLRLDETVDPRYDNLATIERWTFINVRRQEREIEEAFDKYSVDNNFHEWGARVTEAMRIHMEPKWLIYVLAGTYWRIWGHPQHGIHCFRRALAAVPDRFKDVVLTNLAGLLYKTGAIDEALLVMKDVIDIDDRDPDSNFFIANIYSAKGNMSGAIHHYRQTLRMLPEHPLALHYLLIPECHAKFNLEQENQETDLVPAPPSEALNIQRNVNNRNVRIHVRKGIDDPKTIVAAGVDISDGKLKGVDYYKAPVQGACNKEGEDCPQTASRSGEPMQLVDRVGPDERPSKPNVPPGPPPRKDLQQRRLSSTGSVVSSGGDRSSGTIHCVDGRCRFMTKEELAQEEKAKKASKKKRAKKKGKKPAKEEETAALRDAPTTAPTMHEMDIEEGPEVPESIHKEIEGIAKRDMPGKNGDFIGPPHLQDGEEPEILMRVYERADDAASLLTPKSSTLPSSLECEAAKKVNWEMFTSTWLSVSAKGIDIREYITSSQANSTEPESIHPFCDPEAVAVPAVSLLSLDHLEGVKRRALLHFASEPGLKDAFAGLTGEKEGGVKVEEMARRVAASLNKNSTSWVLSTAAALYWRVVGHAHEAVNCLRSALYHAPDRMKDIPLLSLANILHRAGMLNDALVVANMALEISPKFVVLHFTMANIYASKGDFEMATAFYLSTLHLQSSFEPARDRLISIQCDRQGQLTT